MKQWIDDSPDHSFDQFELQWLPRLDVSNPEVLLETLIHKPTGRRFQFEPPLTSTQPPNPLYEYMGPRECASLSRSGPLKPMFGRWLIELTNELNYWARPDPWEARWRDHASFQGTGFGHIEDGAFSAGDLARASRFLDDFSDYAKMTWHLTEDKLAGLESGLDYLRTQMTETSKLSWIQLVYGILGSYLLALLLPAGLTRQLLIDLLRLILTTFCPQMQNDLPVVDSNLIA